MNKEFGARWENTLFDASLALLDITIDHHKQCIEDILHKVQHRTDHLKSKHVYTKGTSPPPPPEAHIQKQHHTTHPFLDIPELSLPNPQPITLIIKQDIHLKLPDLLYTTQSCKIHSTPHSCKYKQHPKTHNPNQ